MGTAEGVGRMLDAAAPWKGTQRMMSPIPAAAHAIPVKLDAEPLTTKAPTSDDIEEI